MLLWLWCRPAVTALIRTLAWELPYAVGAALKKKEKKNPNKNKNKPMGPNQPYKLLHSKGNHKKKKKKIIYGMGENTFK